MNVHYFLFLLSLAASQHTKYEGYRVLKVYPSSAKNERKVLKIVDKYGLNLWRRDHNDKSLDVQVSPNDLYFVTRELQKINTPYTNWIRNIQSLIDKVQKSSSKKSIKPQFTFDRYHTFQEIRSFILNLTGTSFYGPSGDTIHMNHMIIAQTYEENPVFLLKIYKPGPAKQSIFVEGGIHAREWISPAVVLYIMNEFLNNPTRSEQIEDLIDAYDWYFVPVLNPDGYIYTHTDDRLWRKNRQPFEKDHNGEKQICHGVDLNRNFGFHWNPDNGGSTNICSESYSGPTYFSEPETIGIKRFLENSEIEFIAYLSFHSYGQYWLYPWGYVSDYPEDYYDLNGGADAAAKAVSRKFNTSYTVGSCYNALYPASGISIDYAKGSLGIKYSYTCELRDKAEYGFLLPEDQIIPTCEETMDGIMTLATYMKTSGK